MTTAVPQKTGLCESCKNFKPVAYTDLVEREYCSECLVTLPKPIAGRLMEYLLSTIPFRVGDRVECRTGAVLFDGIGTIDEVSMDPADYGTPVYPSFHVVIDEKAYPSAPDDLWYCENQLRKIEQ